MAPGKAPFNSLFPNPFPSYLGCAKITPATSKEKGGGVEEVGDTTSHWFGKYIQANEMLAQLLFLDVWMNVSLLLYRKWTN